MSSARSENDSQPSISIPTDNTRLEVSTPALFSAADVEREIKRLGNVISARVLSTGKEIQEIHILAPHTSTPKKIVRNIETLLLVQFGIRLDHRRVSIVQLGELEGVSRRKRRARIQQLTKADGKVRLNLAVGEKLISGEAQVIAEGGELGAGGRAVLEAAEQFASPGVLHLCESRIVELEQYRVALVLLRWSNENHQELLIGTSLVQADPLMAMAQATLDALNRRFGQNMT